jgi:hypothetical protein
MQLPLGSRWTDHQGQKFKVDAVNTNGEETWVEYCRVKDNTSYRCLAEAFINRFRRTENDSRT